jgi:F420-0:gamma-glutamyl ligase-like protein
LSRESGRSRYTADRLLLADSGSSTPGISRVVTVRYWKQQTLGKVGTELPLFEIPEIENLHRMPPVNSLGRPPLLIIGQASA